jgi:VWFA-related protein
MTPPVNPAWVAPILTSIVLTTIAVSSPTMQTRTPAQNAQQTPTFRATANYFSTDVIVRDRKGQFVPNLRQDEFRVFEDGVEQKIINFQAFIGGRAFGTVSAAPPPITEGVILPTARPPTDTSGRIFIIFIDDMHLQALDTPMVRDVLKQIRDTLVHDGDLIGIVSSGYSSIAIDLTYDYGHRRFTEAINKVMGSGMSPEEIISTPEGAEGVAQLRYNINVAFSTAYGILEQAAKVTDRRKSFIYVSNGYDLNPFQDSRYKLEQERYGLGSGGSSNSGESGSGSESGSENTSRQDDNPFRSSRLQFAEADLISQIAELVRAAQRANVTFYTVDPRGLSAGPGIETRLSMEEWRRFVDTSVSSLLVLANETGGFCICNTNDFKRGLRRIDDETSDYYIIGYNSTNPDPLKVVRRVKIEAARPELDLRYRDVYTLQRRRK